MKGFCTLRHTWGTGVNLSSGLLSTEFEALVCLAAFPPRPPKGIQNSCVLILFWLLFWSVVWGSTFLPASYLRSRTLELLASLGHLQRHRVQDFGLQQPFEHRVRDFVLSSGLVGTGFETLVSPATFGAQGMRLGSLQRPFGHRV